MHADLPHLLPEAMCIVTENALPQKRMTSVSGVVSPATHYAEG